MSSSASIRHPRESRTEFLRDFLVIRPRILARFNDGRFRVTTEAKAEGATHFLAQRIRGWPPTSPPRHCSPPPRPRPHDRKGPPSMPRAELATALLAR